MLDLRYVLDHLDEVRTALLRRGAAASAPLARIEELGEQRKRAIHELEALLRERNAASEAMAKIADKKSPEFVERREALRALGDRAKQLEAQQKEAQAKVEEVLLSVPNVPYESIPDGQSEADNRVVRVVGEKPEFAFTAKDHVDLGLGLGIFDFERGAKLAGARFTVLRGAGAQLERALMMFMLDLHTGAHGYTEIWPPALVNADSLRGTGQLPKFESDLFALAQEFGEGDNLGLKLYLSPTAEVQLTNLHRDEILDGASLPLKYTAYTPCFRAEAGSHGRDVRGLIRQHQFDKVELVQFVEAEQGLSALEQLTADAEDVLKQLGLHYRVVELCAGDMGANARRTYDLEVWLPGQNAYREISSCSWFGDYQARRAKVRQRKSKGDKPELVHTLNGSGLAIGRTLVALLEQHQQADGSVRVPPALAPYMRGLEVIPGLNMALVVERDRSLAALTTLGLGGPARQFVEADQRSLLLDALAWADTHAQPLRILGGGSNLIVSDRGVDGLVVHVATRGIELSREADGALLTVQAGELWDDVVELAVSERLAGIECLTGIPGTTGATPIQNVGAYGQEVSEVVDAVEVLDRESGQSAWLPPEACAFGYRDSRFKRSPERFVVLAVRLRLRPDGAASVRYDELARALGAVGDPAASGSVPSLREVQQTVRALRARKGMLIDVNWEPSAGSFFTNPVLSVADAERVVAAAVARGVVASAQEVPRFAADSGRVKLSAGWLVERAAVEKGLRRGAVGVSARHALALVHHGGGTTLELLALATEIQQKVSNIFGVSLTLEPVCW